MPWVAFGTTFLCLILIAIAADHLTTRLENDDQWISHSQDVERMLGRLRGDLFAAEVGRLLYVLTGTQTHAAPYNVSDRIPQEVEELKALTTDNPSQQAHIEALRKVVNQRMGVLAELDGCRGRKQRRNAKPSLPICLPSGSRP